MPFSHTVSSVDSNNGLIYSNPSNSDWSIRFIISLKNKRQMPFYWLQVVVLPCLFSSGNSRIPTGSCHTDIQKHQQMGQKVGTPLKMYFILMVHPIHGANLGLQQAL